MKFVKQLINFEAYKTLLDELASLEKSRIYCNHTLSHFLDVARIGLLLAYENNLMIDKESFYLAALLHDMGRIEEYKSKKPHHEASLTIAKKLLESIDYPKESINQVLSIIENHRDKTQPITTIAGLLAKADTLSRNCFYCSARATCKWSEDKKNKTILY